MKKLLMVLLVLGVVVISGCTIGGGGGSGSTNGLIISSFSVDPTEVYPGDTVYLYYDISNVGGAVATGIQTEIIGLPRESWGIELSSPPSSELNPPEAGMEGETEIVEWTLNAPSEQQVTLSYPGEVTVSYGYSTHTESLIRVANRDWVRSLPEDQRKTEMDKLGEINSGSEQGPIHTTLRVAGRGYSDDPSRVTIDIQNVGGGAPSNNLIDIQVTGLTGCDIQNPIELVKGQYKQIRGCRVGKDVNEWENVRVDIDLNYDYTLRNPFEITVVGSPTGEI